MPLWRSLFDKPIKDYKAFLVFYYLLCRARHSPTSWQSDRGFEVPLQKAQVATTQRVIAKALGMSRNTIHRIIEKLVKSRKINVDNLYHLTTVTIIDYDLYSSSTNVSQGTTCSKQSQPVLKIEPTVAQNRANPPDGVSPALEEKLLNLPIDAKSILADVKWYFNKKEH